MGLFWWLSFLACTACCFLTRAEDYEEQVYTEASSSDGSIHGFRPCLDDSCSALSQDSGYDAATTWDLLSAIVRAQKDLYPVPEAVTPDSDAISEYCLPMHTSTVRHISSIEARHPSIMDVKIRIIADFIRFLSDFTLLNTTNCDASMSLIGYMSLAVQSLQIEYSKHCEYCDCVYTAGVEENMTGTSTTEAYSSEENMAGTSTTYSSVSSEESREHGTLTDSSLGDESYKTPCPEDSHDSYEETYAEDLDHTYGSSVLVGSIRGVPGVNFPNYTDIPLTSFSCADKLNIPGFYADVETDCQVFHVCYEHRRESFLCPLGTTFNQPILACDYWYSSNCSLAKDYYEKNVKSEEEVKEEAIEVIKEMIEECEEAEVVEDKSEAYEEIDSQQVEESHSESTDEVKAQLDIRQFLPVKAKVVDFEKPVVKGVVPESVDKPETSQDVQEVASQIFDKIVSTATDAASKAKVIIDKVPEPVMEMKPVSADWGTPLLEPILPSTKLAAVSAKKIAAVKSAIPVAKLVVAKAAAIPAAKVAAVKIPILAAKKVVPLAAATAKLAAVKSVPVVAVKKIVPLAAKAAVPVLVAKKIVPLAAKAAVSVAVPVAKVAAVKTAIPVAAKVAAVKTTIPIAAKAAAVKTAIPIAAKAAAVKTAIPIAAKAAAVKATVPIAAKAKLSLAVPAKKVALSGVKVAAAIPKLAVPVLKSKFLVPATKGKVLKAAAVPVLKAKILPVKGTLAGIAPLAKAKLVKTAAISPLTKKALALGYMKLLKAKKLALMG